MPKTLVRKLVSERGATITLALLLFIVCVTLGSIILAAASASSGRMSELAKMDQRYYSVTSAVELFQDQLGDGYAEAVQTRTCSVPMTDSAAVLNEDEVKEGDVEPTYHENGDKDFPAPVVNVLDSDGGVLDASAYPVLTFLTSELAFGTPKEPATGTSISWRNQAHSLNDGGLKEKRSITLQIAVNEGSGLSDEDQLKVKVKGSISEDGRATLTFTNDNGDTDLYELKMILEPDYETYTETSNYQVKVAMKNGVESLATTYTEELHTTVAWHVVDIETV